MKPRLLVIVGRDKTQSEIDQSVAELSATILPWLGTGVDLVDTQRWYQQHFARCGNWDSWIWDTVLGKSYATREFHFNGFVVCVDPLGRAGAGIVNLALRNGRPVLRWRDQTIQNVIGVDQVRHDDWQSGFTVRSQPIGGP